MSEFGPELFDQDGAVAAAERLPFYDQKSESLHGIENNLGTGAETSSEKLDPRERAMHAIFDRFPSFKQENVHLCLEGSAGHIQDNDWIDENGVSGNERIEQDLAAGNLTQEKADHYSETLKIWDENSDHIEVSDYFDAEGRLHVSASWLEEAGALGREVHFIEVMYEESTAELLDANSVIFPDVTETAVAAQPSIENGNIFSQSEDNRELISMDEALRAQLVTHDAPEVVAAARDIHLIPIIHETVRIPEIMPEREVTEIEEVKIEDAVEREEIDEPKSIASEIVSVRIPETALIRAEIEAERPTEIIDGRIETPRRAEEVQRAVQIPHAEAAVRHEPAEAREQEIIRPTAVAKPVERAADDPEVSGRDRHIQEPVHAARPAEDMSPHEIKVEIRRETSAASKPETAQKQETEKPDARTIPQASEAAIQEETFGQPETEPETAEKNSSESNAEIPPTQTPAIKAANEVRQKNPQSSRENGIRKEVRAPEARSPENTIEIFSPPTFDTRAETSAPIGKEPHLDGREIIWRAWGFPQAPRVVFSAERIPAGNIAAVSLKAASQASAAPAHYKAAEDLESGIRLFRPVSPRIRLKQAA